MSVRPGSDSHQCLPHGANSTRAFADVTNRSALIASALHGAHASRCPSNALEHPDLLRDGAFSRKAFHGARAVEAVDAAALRDDVFRVGRLRDRAAVADDEDIRIHAARGVRDPLDPRDAVVQRLRALRPDRSSGGDAHVGDDEVGTRAGHALGLGRIEDVGRRQQIQLAGEPDDVDFELVAHAGFLEGLAHVAIEETDRREVLNAGEAQRPKLFEEESGDDERIGPVDAGEDRCLLDDREHLVGHLLDDLVGVPVREETRGASAAGHPVAPRVVDDQQVDAARLLAHGGEPGAGAAADDRLAARDLLAESLQNALPGIVHAHRASCHCQLLPTRFTSVFISSSSFAAAASAKSGSLI